MNDAEKKARLAAALRENLRKRKAQARGVETKPEPPREGEQGTTRIDRHSPE